MTMASTHQQHSSPTLVIAAGNGVTTWEPFQTKAQAFTFYPHGDIPIADAAWNHNGQVLATCSALSTDEKEHNTVVLTAAQTGSRLDALQHNQQWQRRAGATTSLAFGGKSRYLCIGDSSGAVCLWDLKKKLRVRQFFHETGCPSRQVSLDPTDTYVLSLSERLFSIYNLREGTPAATWAPQGTYAYTRYHTSTLEPHLTAVGTSDGSLLLYDITNHEKSVPFFGLSRRHQGPITGLAFSPTNPKLLASASSDGTLKFFDKTSGTTIDQLASLNTGITSLTMHSDGVCCAVGTETGEIILYDLRQSIPLASMNVEGPVASLQFAPPPKNNNKGTPSSTTPASKPVAASNQPQQHQHQQMEQSRRGVDQGALKEDQPQTANYNGIFSSEIPQQQQQQQPMMLSSQQSVAETAYAHPQSYAGPPGGKSTSATTKPPPTSSSPKMSSTQQSVSTFGGGAVSIQPLSPQKQMMSSSPMMKQQLPKPPAQPSPSTQQAPSYRGVTVAKEDEKKVSEPMGNMDGVRDLVRDEVENLRDDVEEAIRNLHMDMISQFHQQSQELNHALSAQLTTIDRLTDENQRLREENDRLKEQSSDNM